MSLKVEVNEQGDHELGQTVEGVFVPYLTVPASRVGQLVQRAKDLAAASKAKTAGNGG